MQSDVNAGRLPLVDRFPGGCEAFVARLPLGLSSVVAPTFVGYCLINGLSFGADLSLLTGLHGWLGVPVPVAVTLAYVCASALSYALNRSANFRSHAPAGPQIAVYAAVVVVNYLAFSSGSPACWRPSACSTSCRGWWRGPSRPRTCTVRCDGSCSAPEVRMSDLSVPNAGAGA